jgi:hypothetical protein
VIKVTVKLDKAAIANLKAAALKSAEVAMEQVRTDLVSSATLPADQYVLQNGGTYVNGNGPYQGYKDQNSVVDFSSSDEKIHISLVNDVPQARRLYYHPEYHFQQGKNANAGAGWLEPYVSGGKKDLARDAFIYDFKRRTGV